MKQTRLILYYSGTWFWGLMPNPRSDSFLNSRDRLDNGCEFICRCFLAISL